MSEPDSPTDDGEHRIDKASIEYQQKFDLPADEILHDTFLCALQKGILHQGRLYVSQHYICFYSNILLSEAKLIIRADRIEEVVLAKVLIFPTAIRVKHDDGVESLFASFLAREKCYNLLLQISRGERIGSQRVKSSRELDRPTPSLQRTPTYIDQPDRHLQLLDRSQRKKKNQEENGTPHGASSSSSSSKPRSGSQRDHHDDDGSTLSKFHRPKRKDSSSDEELEKNKPRPPKEESTFDKITSMLTSVHVTQAPKVQANVISTPHGVVVLAENPKAVLPPNAKFRHTRTGSLAPGLDGPAVAVAAGGMNNGSDGGHSPLPYRPSIMHGAGGERERPRGRSTNTSPMPGAKPSPVQRAKTHAPARAEDGRERKTSDRDLQPPRRTQPQRSRSPSSASEEESKPSTARAKSTQKSVALAMKPRTKTPKKKKREEEEEEEED